MNARKPLKLVLLLATGLMILMVGSGMLFGSDEESDTPKVYLIDVDGTINPALADHIIKGIETAEKDKAAAVIIRLDTPGGVLATTKTIVKAIINAKLPVVVYVAPSGSSATSAGAIITVCADIAAMAPGTNIGAAHPVGAGGEEIDSTMSEKIINDLTAYVRGIVSERGRNADWAERAIRHSVSVTAKEALELKAIDLIADSVQDLLDKVDGMTIKIKGKHLTVSTKGARVEKLKSGMRFKILDVVANPNIAYFLFMVAIACLMMEVYNPGMIFPGAVGVICLLLFLFAVQALPVNHVGIMLIVLAVILFVLEVKITSFGILTLGGIASLTLGSIMLFESEESALRVSWALIIPTVAVVSAFFVFIMGLAAKAWMRKPQTGEEGLVGEVGIAVTDLANEGKVFVHGEYWNARSDGLIPRGDRVRVVKVDNLSMFVPRG